VRDTPMRAGSGAASSGIGWTQIPNAPSLWWTSLTRFIPGSGFQLKSHHAHTACAQPHAEEPIPRVDQSVDFERTSYAPCRAPGDAPERVGSFRLNGHRLSCVKERGHGVPG
jgi:hypothetical protein